MTPTSTPYFVFDVESVADGDLVRRIRYPAEDLSPVEAVARYREELLETKGSDFIPYTFHIPVSVVVAKVAKDFRLQDIAVLDTPHFRPHIITETFWRGWDLYGQPTLITFNGRTFDVPLLELAAFRYGICIKNWFAQNLRSFEQPRNRYNIAAHLDLQDQLINFGATRFSGGLNLAANLLGKPGKMTVQGDMVQALYEDGKLAEINDYCRCDVLDTYFVFLRHCVVTGKLSLNEEQQILGETKAWLQQQAEGSVAYRQYLDQWGDWRNPWNDNEPTQ